MQHHHSPGARTDLHDGFSDHLQPTVPLDLSQIHNFSDLLKAMSLTGFGGRSLGEAADVLYEMVTSPDCFVVGTFSGEVTKEQLVAKLKSAQSGCCPGGKCGPHCASQLS